MRHFLEIGPQAPLDLLENFQLELEKFQSNSAPLDRERLESAGDRAWPEACKAGAPWQGVDILH
jgi:hypothetical protein